MKVDEYVRRCILRDPNFFKNRGDVLLYTLTNDRLVWQGGGFEDLAYGDIDEFDAIYNLLRDSLDFQMKFRCKDATKVREERYSSFRRTSDYLMNCFNVLLTLDERIKKFEPSAKIIVLQPESCLLNIPEKIFDDWKLAVKETYLYIKNNKEKLTEESIKMLNNYEKNIHKKIFRT